MNWYANQQSNTSSSDAKLELPEEVFTRSGIGFDPNKDVWNWVDGPFNVHMAFGKLTICSEEIKESLKFTLSVFAKGSSASHISNLFDIFKNFIDRRIEKSLLKKITIQEISNFESVLQDHEKWRLGTLSVLLQKWVSLDLKGVDPECSRYLRERRKQGNIKGDAVRTRDPINGPFSESEYTALYKAVDTAYGINQIPSWAAILTRLLFACGGRISQYASLKIKDFVCGKSSFHLNLPQAKTREKHARVSFQTFDISPQTGNLIAEYIKIKKNDGYSSDSALFLDDEIRINKSLKTMRPSGDMFSGHCTSNHLANAFSKIIRSISPPSDRLGFGPIPIGTRRFRYTLGTRLAEEGLSKIVIAQVLGHVDLQNVDVYFAASPKIVKNIDKAMDAQLIPLANAFKGRLIGGENEATHKGNAGSKIIDFRVSKNPVGSCGGKGKGCEFNKPIACYTCFKFEPWLDAPHEKVLHRLIEERTKFASDERMAAVNDDAILAIQQVLQECAHTKNQMQEEN